MPLTGSQAFIHGLKGCSLLWVMQETDDYDDELYINYSLLLVFENDVLIIAYYWYLKTVYQL